MSPITQGFLDRSLNPASFGHEQHVHVAWDLLSNYDFMEATVRYVTGIRTIAKNAGAPGKFHMTVTLAYLSVIAERMASAEYSSFEHFLESNADLLSKDSLSCWYDPDRLNTPLARTQFVMPGISGV